MNLKYSISIVLFFAFGSKLLGQDNLPLTTKSAEARALYDEGMFNLEKVLRTPAIEKMMAATKADPDFAMAHATLLLIAHDQDVERRARLRAKALRARSSAGEQLFITWAVAQKENDLVT